MEALRLTGAGLIVCVDKQSISQGRLQLGAFLNSFYVRVRLTFAANRPNLTFVDLVERTPTRSGIGCLPLNFRSVGI